MTTIERVDWVIDWLCENKSSELDNYELPDLMDEKLPSVEVDEIFKELFSLDIVERLNYTLEYHLIGWNRKTQEFKDNGGYNGHLNRKDFEIKRQHEKETTEFQKLKDDAELSYRKLRDYKIFKWIAIISFVLSIISIIISVFA